MAQAQTPLRAQPTASEFEADAVFVAWQGDASIQRCGICHFSPGNQFAKRDTDFCRLDELERWLKKDKHAIARQRIEPIATDERDQAEARIVRNLAARSGATVKLPKNWIGESNSLSFAMCKRLGYDVQTEEGYASFRTNCLTCHGGYEPAGGSDGFSPGDAARPGVGCNYCHQIGSDSRWIDEHSGFETKATWRALPAQAKAEKGMRDLVSAGAQAQLCYRCHIGDLERGMFVSHAMYAAGHPPLPGVELNSLVEAMPRHWRSPGELYQSLKNSPQRSAYFAANYPGISENAGEAMRVDRYPWRIDTMLRGALASQQQSLRLTAQAANPSSNHWGDYALYDCAACHHDLHLPSARQKARQKAFQPGAPGRPRLHEWPQTLSRAVGTASGEEASLTPLNSRLLSAVTQRPFGDRAAVAQAASELHDALEQLQQRVTTKPLTEAFAHDLLSALAETPEPLLIDYHAARQIALAIRCIDADLEQLGKPLPSELRAAIAKLGIGTSAASTAVSIDLPGGPDRAIYPDFLKPELERQANYDPAQFIQQLRRVHARP